MKKSDRRGQAMTEYILTSALLMASVAILAVFLYTFRAHGVRILDLVAYDYP